MPKVIYSKTKGLHQTAGFGTVGLRREIINVTSADKTLTVDESGALVTLNGTGGVRAIQLPYITSKDVGVYYDFFVGVIGNQGAAGAYTISTGGHATDTSGKSNTAKYDDFIGTLLVADAGVQGATATTMSVTPAAGDGQLLISQDQANREITVGSYFRCTAIAESTTVDNTNVWLLDGYLILVDQDASVDNSMFIA